MKDGWGTKRLGELADVIAGQSPKGAFYNTSGSGTPFYQGKKEFGDKFIGSPTTWTTHVTRIAVEGDVLMSVRAPVGPVNFATEEICIGRGLAAIRARADLDRHFLFYCMLSKRDEIAGTEGAVFPSINKNQISQIEVPHPPLPEQRRIVGILDEAFDGIAVAKANAEKNLQNARALFESHLNAVFTERGEGWVEKQLSDVCRITSSLVDPKQDAYLDLIHVGAGNIASHTGAFIALQTAREEGLISGKFPFDKTMVLYSKIRPYLRKVARPDFNGLCSADMYPLAPIAKQTTRDYLFYLLLSKPFTEYAIEGSARSGMPKVNRKHLFQFRTWLPDTAVQTSLTGMLDALAAETDRLQFIYQRKLAALDELKKSLLDQAFSGAL
jgi:type I restriction enzyme, S subunit